MKSVNEMKEDLDVDTLETRYIKQKSSEWQEARKQVTVTGSTIYGATGYDGLKRELEHFDSVISKEEKKLSAVCEEAMKYGTDCEVHEIATVSSVMLPFLYRDLDYHEDGFCLDKRSIVSPDGSLRKQDNNKVVYAFEAKAPVE